MTKLEKLYQSIDNLKQLGVEITKEQLKVLDEFEEEVIKDEVIPALSQDIAPRLNPIKRELVLVVEYHPGDPIRVALSRKAKISDFIDAKPLTLPVNQPVTSDEKPIPQDPNREPTKRVEHNTKGLKVIFPNGTVICRTKAIDTYIATIKYIGYERVASLNIQHSSFNIVSRQKRPTKPGRIWQHKSDGWYIYSNTSNIVKMEDLKEISDRLRLGLRIEEGKPENSKD